MILALALIVLFGATPVIATLAASGMGRALGCTLNAGGAHPCLLFGLDIGGALHVMFVSHWFAMVTVPVAIMVLVVWAVVALILLLLHRRRQRRRQTV
jgi:hypothetical protein